MQKFFGWGIDFSPPAMCNEYEQGVRRHARMPPHTFRACMIRFLQQVKDVNMTLADAEEGKEYIVRAIDSDDDELLSFLLSLGCYVGQSVTVVSRRRSGCVIAVKNGRYGIDDQLAALIQV